MASFNFIAPYYDLLSGLVYGDNLNQAKKCFLKQLPVNARILLMGGGTGAILNELLEFLPEAVVDYIEPSSVMINTAKNRLNKQFISRVNFICGDHHSIPFRVNYDAVTSFFILDCFTQEEALDFGKVITQQLKENGIWLFADFFAEKNLLHLLLIWIMYRFFRIVSGISARRLPDYENVFSELKFRCSQEQYFLSGLIRSKVYRRASL